jgi:hypothetical protein
MGAASKGTFLLWFVGDEFLDAGSQMPCIRRAAFATVNFVVIRLDFREYRKEARRNRERNLQYKFDASWEKLVGRGPQVIEKLEPRARVELATCRLRIGCSTTELPRL